MHRKLETRSYTGKWNAQNYLELSDTNGSPKLDYLLNDKKIRTCQLVYFAFLVEHREKVKEIRINTLPKNR